MRIRTRLLQTLSALSLAASAPGSLQAQASATFDRAFRLGAGPSFYRFDSHSGTGVDVTLGLSHSIGRHLILEGSVSDFDLLESYDAAGMSGSNRTRFLMPEIDLQVQGGMGNVRPYLGVGAGGAIRLNGQVKGGGTVHAAVGSRFYIGRRIDLRLEGRVRSIRPFHDRLLDATIGIEIVRW